MFDILVFPGVREKDLMMVFQVLAAILHFGNVDVLEAEGDSSTIAVSSAHAQFHLRYNISISFYFLENVHCCCIFIPISVAILFKWKYMFQDYNPSFLTNC